MEAPRQVIPLQGIRKASEHLAAFCSSIVGAGFPALFFSIQINAGPINSVSRPLPFGSLEPQRKKRMLLI
jgi:hypothetical protein